MTSTKEQTQEEQRRQFQHEAQNPSNEKVQTQSETDRRHYEPIQTALPNEATGYDWKRETGVIQSYQQSSSGSWLHIDSQGQFYDRQASPISREVALEHLRVSVNQVLDNTDKNHSITPSADSGLTL